MTRVWQPGNRKDFGRDAAGSGLDADCFFDHGFGHVEIDGGAGVDPADGLAMVDGLADLDELVEADGGIDAIGGLGAPGAELEGGLADEAGVDAGDQATGGCVDLAEDRGAVDFEEAGEVGRVAALGGDEVIKLAAGAAVVDDCGELFGREAGDRHCEVEDEFAEVGWTAAVEAIERFGDFKGVADGAAGGFTHRVEKGVNLDVHFAADGDH